MYTFKAGKSWEEMLEQSSEWKCGRALRNTGNSKNRKELAGNSKSSLDPRREGPEEEGLCPNSFPRTSLSEMGSGKVTNYIKRWRRTIQGITGKKDLLCGGGIYICMPNAVGHSYSHQGSGILCHPHPPLAPSGRMKNIIELTRWAGLDFPRIKSLSCPLASLLNG